jgi:hypothetical protein
MHDEMLRTHDPLVMVVVVGGGGYKRINRIARWWYVVRGKGEEGLHCHEVPGPGLGKSMEWKYGNRGGAGLLQAGTAAG